MEPAILIGAISALTSALIYVAKITYTEVKTERDHLRAEVLAALTAIALRMNEVARERDAMVTEIGAKLDSLKRMLSRRKAPP